MDSGNSSPGGFFRLNTPQQKVQHFVMTLSATNVVEVLAAGNAVLRNLPPDHPRKPILRDALRMIATQAGIPYHDPIADTN